MGEDNAYPVIDRAHVLGFYQLKESELWKLPELPYLSVNSNLESQEQQFEYEKYADELLKHFEFPDGYEPSDDEVENHKKFEIAVENFRASCDNQRLSDTPPYQKDDEQSMEMVPATTVEQENVNDDWTRTMLFNMFGSGSCLVPTIVNIDKHFSVINGNVNYNLAELSSYAYHWFLIHGKCPEYLKNDIRSLRYFESIPQLTSRIVRVNTFYCETMFLGVKYLLPLKYENWQFAVYLDPNNQLDIERNYRFEIDTVNHRLYLKIGYFVDYTDLIRGGEMKTNRWWICHCFTVLKIHTTKHRISSPDLRKQNCCLPMKLQPLPLRLIHKRMVGITSIHQNHVSKVIRNIVRVVST